jgi:Pentapeptide repeats (8 copies)
VTFRNTRFGNCDLSGADLREAVLSSADLSGITGFLGPEQLAGADLTGAKLPNSLGELFENLDVAKGISANAQNLFIAMLAACLYSWLTIATTSDVNLIVNRATSPLPIIGTSIPIVGFYFVAPLLLVGIYFYLHLYCAARLAAIPAGESPANRRRSSHCCSYDQQRGGRPIRLKAW